MEAPRTLAHTPQLNHELKLTNVKAKLTRHESAHTGPIDLAEARAVAKHYPDLVHLLACRMTICW
jgi:hypothetical protein